MESFVLTEKPRDRKRNRIIIACFVIFIIIVSYVVYHSVVYGIRKAQSNAYSSTDAINSVYLKSVSVSCGVDNTFKAYVANNNADREKGLSIFNKINDSQAMLFVFDSSKKYSFWMKDMKFPIDIVWLDENGQIVFISENVPVDSYPNMFTPDTDSRYVLEFNADIVKKDGIKIGDTCNFDFRKLK